MAPIRLLLLDDHILFREGLRRLLVTEPNFEVVAECGTASEALLAVRSKEIDVILLDFDLEDETGTRFISAAVAAGYRGKILMVTAGMSAPEVSAARRLGISGIFPKHDSPKALLEAIRKVASGAGWTDSVVPVTANGPLKSALTNSRIPLTNREQLVLRSVFEGRSNKEIAYQVGASLSAVKGTLQQLFDKMGARTRAQLVRMAIEHSLDNAETPFPGPPAESSQRPGRS
jgi:two-component system, NarL family, nitrate/nitrite response regulator NarL